MSEPIKFWAARFLHSVLETSSLAPVAALPRAHRAGASNTDAFREAVATVLPAVMKCLRRFGVYRDEMDDALQIVLLQMYRHWKTVQHSGARGMRTFACCVAVNVARDFSRVNKRNLDRTLPLDEALVDWKADPFRVVAYRKSIAFVDGVLATMSLERQEIFVLYEVEGLTVKEIAAALRIPEGTAASRLRSARSEFEACVDLHSAQDAKP